MEFPNPGLYTFPHQMPGGRNVRIHLRVHPDHSGILFFDLEDAIHLNQSAVCAVKHCLDGRTIESVLSQVLSKQPFLERKRFRRDVENIYRMISAFKNNERDCIPCITESLTRHPIFSMKVDAPYKVDLALTYRCNNKCSHCYNQTDRATMVSISLGDWYRVIDILIARGVPHLILTGGEPTLYPHILEIITYANQSGAIVGMNTNGRRLADPGFLEALFRAGLNHVQVTLESHIPGVHDAMVGAGAYHQTIHGIQNALGSNLHTITNTTITRLNCDQIEGLIHFLYDLGIHTFAMNSMIHAGKGSDHPDAIPEERLAPLLIQIREQADDLNMRFLWYTPTRYCRLSPVEFDLGFKRCNAGQYSFCIEPNADVLPCQSAYQVAGNLLTDSWDQIWNSEIFRRFRDRVEHPQDSFLPSMCWDCPDLRVCGGGCRLESLVQLEPLSQLPSSIACVGCAGGAG